MASIKIHAIFSIIVFYRKNLKCGLGFELLLLSFDPSVSWPKIGSVVVRVAVSLGMLDAISPFSINSRFDRHQSENSSSRIVTSVATDQCKQCTANLNSNANSWDLCSFFPQFSSSPPTPIFQKQSIPSLTLSFSSIFFSDLRPFPYTFLQNLIRGDRSAAFTSAPAASSLAWLGRW